MRRGRGQNYLRDPGRVGEVVGDSHCGVGTDGVAWTVLLLAPHHALYHLLAADGARVDHHGLYDGQEVCRDHRPRLSLELLHHDGYPGGVEPSRHQQDSLHVVGNLEDGVMITLVYLLWP